MRTLQSLSRACLVGAATVFGAAGAAHAALYGTFTGPNITYQNVGESDSQVSGPPIVNSVPSSLFGAPALIPTGSDILTFPDLSFSAQAADGTFVLQDGKLQFNIVPTTPTSDIHSISFDEGGAYHLQNTGVPADASDEASLIFNDLRITSVAGQTLATPIIVSPVFTESATPSSGSILFTTTTGGDLSFQATSTSSVGTWDMTATFNLDAALAQAGLAGEQITGISVGLNNQLLAQTTEPDGPGLTLATIDKKHFIITPVTTSVPEPASLALLAGGGLLLTRRRKASK